jgi:DNA-binding transcriptional regulator YiaG
MDQERSIRKVGKVALQATRFSLALKKARLAKQLKQEALAAQLHVKLRTLVSWETGTRIPSIGMVILLNLLLTDGLDLSNDLLLAYIADDLTHQAYIQGDKEFRTLALRTLEQVSQLQRGAREQAQEREPHLSLFGNQSREGHQEHRLDQQEVWQQEHQREGATGDPLQQLFAVLEILRTHPELIPVVQDFLREVATYAFES